jgi:tetratricopeptide (TPR) repeat protein
MSKTKNSKKEISPQQKLIFRLITAFVPFIILLSFEGILRVVNYGDNLDLFIQNPTEGYENYMIVNPIVGKKYFQKFEYSNPPNDIFLTDKPENTFRIFVMGSSTVYGFPYERNLMFSRILHKQLEDAYPGIKIEMVNTAIIAINSFTLLDFIDQILKYEPDAVLIYAGHNEFYGAFGIGSNETMSRNKDLTKLHIGLMDYRIYQLLRNMIAGVSQKIGTNDNKVQGTLMKRMVADKDILLNSEKYNIAMERYRQNMDEILEKIHKKNVPVFLSEVISNINGMEPFQSISAEGLEAANDVYQKAKEAEEKGDFAKASELYYKAKDLDCIRFRASEDVNKIIKELGLKYEVYPVLMLDWFKSLSPNRLIGNTLMTEHVHPNIDGNFIMSRAFGTAVIKSEVIKANNEDKGYTSSYRKLNYGYTALDSLVAMHRVKTLKGNWPFVKAGEKEINYQKQYRPGSYIDSLAFSAISSKEISVSMVRLELAKKYKKNGQYYLAYKEYDALLRTNPYLAVNYRDAATSLIDLEDLPGSLKYFQKSLEYEESGFALFKMGEIYLFMGDYTNAISHFEKAFPLIPDDKKVVVLVKSYMASVYANDVAKSKAFANELKRVNAENYLKIPPKQYVSNQYIPYQTRKQVNEAKQLIADNQPDEALEILLNSLKIYDSHIAKRLIGEIYFSRRDAQRASAYFNSVYEPFKFDVEFLHKYATTFIAKNDPVNARKLVEEINRINPNYEYLKVLNTLLLSTK